MTPEILRLRAVAGAEQARGLAVIIDVIRAFTVAAYAFEGGAEEIMLVGTIEEAFALRERFPTAMLIGEVGGRTIPGFDLNNSPTRMAAADVRGRRLIQRTGAGTQGVVAAAGADAIVLASLVVGRATAEYICRQAPSVVSIVAMAGDVSHAPMEDDVCADYLAALIRGEAPDTSGIRDIILATPHAQLFLDPEDADFIPSDLDYVLAVDRFDFAMPVRREGGLLIARKWLCASL
ncbi:MAG: 2-phosphosulfolactate phosphatase [Anaerolineae bacterium]